MASATVRSVLGLSILLAACTPARGQPVDAALHGRYELTGRNSDGGEFRAIVQVERDAQGRLKARRRSWATRPRGIRGVVWEASAVRASPGLLRVTWRSGGAERGGAREHLDRIAGRRGSASAAQRLQATYRLSADGQTLREELINLTRVAPERWLRSTADGRRVNAGEEEEGPQLPEETRAFERPELWPLSIASASHPLRVHYRVPAEETTAREVLAHLERSWRVEVDELGFRAPLSDRGKCGPDDRFDIYVWRGLEECYVDVVDDGEPSTPWHDEPAYMAVDPWGPYGGPMLAATLAHEFNHACQAADDYYETAPIFEMTSTFMEDLVCDDDDGYMALLEDFQARPDLALDHDDEYETWFMYGGALYLFYVRDRWFQGDPRFVSDLWLRCRNPSRDLEDPAGNEPDFEDALDALLRPRGGSFAGSIVEFARWRWFTGRRDDGKHFEEGAKFPEKARVHVAARVTVGASPTPVAVAIEPAPRTLGSAYVDLKGIASVREVRVSVSPAPAGVRWVVQAVPGVAPGTDGELVPVENGSARVRLGAGGTRTLIVTAMPAEGSADDPDTRDGEKAHALKVTVEAAR